MNKFCLGQEYSSLCVPVQFSIFHLYVPPHPLARHVLGLTENLFYKEVTLTSFRLEAGSWGPENWSVALGRV